MAQAVSGDGLARLDGLSRVDIGDIEDELAKRSRSAAGETGVSRTCALNLVVYVEELGDAGAVAGLIDPIATAHPMRVIQVMLDPKMPVDCVRAWADIDCAQVSGVGALCSERIALVANPEGVERLTSAINALLSADLPVVLWWRAGSPFLSRLFKGLAPLTHKIVVDSIRFGDGPPALDTLHRLNGLSGGRVALGDMNWHRIASWRSTLAACFDDPAVLALLPNIDRSEIAFSLGAEARSAPPSARALLLAGWLISRLPTIAGHGDIAGVRSSWASPGSLLSLQLRSSKSKAGVGVEWSKGDGIKAIAMDADGRGFRSWRFSPDPEAEAELLFRCIDSPGTDALLDAALEVG